MQTANNDGKAPRLAKRLHKEVNQVRGEYPGISEDNAFVLWFSEAQLTGDRKRAFDGITGGTGDMGVDAVYVDEGMRLIHLVQGKYHRPDANNDSDLCEFAGLASDFWNPDFANELKSAGPGAREKLLDAHRILHRNGKADFGLKLHFATTGRITPKGRKKAMRIAEVEGNTELEDFSRVDILALFSAWEEGYSPPLPELEITVDGRETLVHQEGGLQGWIFTTTSQEISRLFRIADERLFARNVRGYLGADTSINKAISKTAKSTPDRFWFLNNGITIVADHVERRDRGKRVRMLMQNPQVVNGQQAVRTLAAAGSSQPKVLVRLIRLAREDAAKGVVGVVADVVRATNWQNAITPADLMANDPEQVRIEREFRKLNYAYERKKQDPKAFAQRALNYVKVKREDLANALAATTLGPHMVRRTDLWEGDKKYPRLFSGKRPVTDYLARWRAAKQVSRVSAVLTEARWVVLGCLWRWPSAALRRFLGSEAARRAFVKACEGGDRSVLGPLHAAAKQLLICAKPIYGRERKRVEEENKSKGRLFKPLTPDAYFRREHVMEAVTRAARKDMKRREKIVSGLKRFEARLLARL